MKILLIRKTVRIVLLVLKNHLCDKIILKLGPNQVWVKSRHGKRFRMPRHLLRFLYSSTPFANVEVFYKVHVLFQLFLPSVETVPFNCHFCTHPGFPSYKEFISHLIDMHLRFEEID